MNKRNTKTNDHQEPLFALVKSMTKSEKRQFKLYVGRFDGNVDAKFYSLFVLLDKMNSYDEDVILKNKIVTKQQLSNLKAHLYRQILVSLRLNPAHKNIRIQIREQLDFATVLYQKGLYKQSLKLLEKARVLAIENEEKNTAYEVVELEKVIETQYITRSIISRSDELSAMAEDLSRQNILTSKLSNLSLQLYGILLNTGYVKNNEELQNIKNFFKARLPEYDIEMLGFREKLWLYKAYLWYSFLIQDFLMSYRYAQKWVDLFHEFPKMKHLNPVFYLKGRNYQLEALFYVKHTNKYKAELTAFEEELEAEVFPLNNNTDTIIFIYHYFSKLNLYFLEGNFDEGLYLVSEIEEKMKSLGSRLDRHYVVVFYYKIACLYFGAGDNKTCISYLEKIINNKTLRAREDLQCFARILSLVAHYDAGLDYHLERQLRETYKFLLKMENLQEVQKEFIATIKGLGNVYPHQINKEFKKIHARLKKFEDHPYEKRAFLYLDILSWLESKIEHKPVAQVIKEKATQYLR